MTRAQGRCEVCGKIVGRAPYSIHHRKPRKMGGTRDETINTPPNLMLVCGTGTTGCHGWIESNRAQAAAAGYLIKGNAKPEDTPITLHTGRRVSLTTIGTYTPVRMGG